MASLPMLTLVRNFSRSSVAAGQLVKAPLAVFGMEGRYANAIYSAASKEKKLNEVEKELKTLQEMISKDKKFVEFILDPSLKKQMKKDTLISIMKKQNASKVTTNFVEVIAENGRLNKLKSILNTFSDIMRAHRGEVLCEVISAKPLDQEMKAELDKALKSFLKQGETIQMHMKVDPSLIGGLVISIGDRYVDMSLASKIKLYTNTLKAAV